MKNWFVGYSILLAGAAFLALVIWGSIGLMHIYGKQVVVPIFGFLIISAGLTPVAYEIGHKVRNL